MRDLINDSPLSSSLCLLQVGLVCVSFTVSLLRLDLTDCLTDLLLLLLLLLCQGFVNSKGASQWYVTKCAHDVSRSCTRCLGHQTRRFGPAASRPSSIDTFLQSIVTFSPQSPIWANHQMQRRRDSKAAFPTAAEAGDFPTGRLQAPPRRRRSRAIHSMPTLAP